MNIWDRLNNHHCIVSGLDDSFDIAEHPKIKMRFESISDTTSDRPMFKSVGPVISFLSKQFIECDCLLCPPKILNSLKAVERVFAQTKVTTIFLQMNLLVAFFGFKSLKKKRGKALPLSAFCQLLAAMTVYKYNVYGYECNGVQFIEISQSAH